MDEFETYLKKTEEIGHIISVTHSIVVVSGLPHLKPREMVISEDGERGIVYSLKEDSAEILMLDIEKLKVGKRVTRTDEIFKIPVSPSLLGRIVNPLCQPLDGQGPIMGEKKFLNIERRAPNITQRVRVRKFLETGVTVVDLLVPIGYGQRELVIGDGKTGKTTFLLQTIVSQAKKGVICIYVLIGKEISHIKTVERYLKKAGVLGNTVILMANSNNPAAVIYLAPYSGMSIAEYFREKGKDVLIIFDDLTVHAKIYREISLLLKRIPGRDAYPGDIFHLHAALMERAGNIKNESGEEISITALPVVETLENDISGYIPTNLMAMTDGHIFFDIDEFRKGKRPSVNVFLSVSRVGNQTKKTIDREAANWVRERLTEYHQALEVAQFGVELPTKTKKDLDLGEKLEIIFNQIPQVIISREFQLFLVGLLLAGFWDDVLPKIMKVVISKKILNLYQKGEFSDIEKKIERIVTIEELKTIAEDFGPRVKAAF